MTFFTLPKPDPNHVFQIHSLKEHIHVHRGNDGYSCPHCSKVSLLPNPAFRMEGSLLLFGVSANAKFIRPRYIKMCGVRK